MAQAGQLPAEWRNPINPATELVGYWNAFMELTTCRQVGMGVGPIPFTAIKEYALLYEISGIRFEVFNRLVRSLDREFLDHSNRKQDALARKG